MLAVVSPHLDDAVFGCGELIAARRGAVAVTVCAAVPDETCMLPEWDAACGFGSARQAQFARRREDRAALESLEAQPCWLWCWDSQYRRRPARVEEVALKLARALRRYRADTIAIPLGLFHSDHKLTHLAALKLMAGWQDRLWLAYEEPNYRLIAEEVRARMAALEQAGVKAVRFEFAADPRWRNLKACAVARYESQLRGLASGGRPGGADLYAPERYWRLSI
jgi:LmbE family N-acetylglucosaminyl deacetylase